MAQLCEICGRRGHTINFIEGKVIKTCHECSKRLRPQESVWRPSVMKLRHQVNMKELRSDKTNRAWSGRRHIPKGSKRLMNGATT